MGNELEKSAMFVDEETLAFVQSGKNINSILEPGYKPPDDQPKTIKDATQNSGSMEDTPQIGNNNVDGNEIQMEEDISSESTPAEKALQH
ncbi:TonB-dependent receptor [Sesbania bispinosa]|nr:TonB-dependent receptor [Sesbania bispinosa]